ncbi:MAG: [FeFe] hydrogenase H-cluster radical SAM maturase HydE [Candidatus Delongbacteria bacterium]|jgi:biotin synthase|nr:[FeFe] hydrogenase H-cluster radical SAM maturase HydE [Candidatus Delongbacteria bacterium]
MSNKIHSILNKEALNKQDIVFLLELDEKDQQLLFKKAAEVKAAYVGKITWFRGLIEYSNICSKNCYYCGIRSGNKQTKRYELTDEEVLSAAQFAIDHQYGSLVLQSGERSNRDFTAHITKLLKAIKQLSSPALGITLSMGEQSEKVFREWYDAGAHRYLLRIESSNPDLYHKLHPDDDIHNFEKRLAALRLLKKLNYQTGTGVMIGTPFQTTEHLANDLIFMRNFDIDMCGMGPYIENANTPLYKHKSRLLPLKDRFRLSLKMIAILRIMMKDINIAAATAMQAIDPLGREKAIMAGANVIMPNITPGKYRNDYDLYENKPCTNEEASDCNTCLEVRIGMTGDKIGYGAWGDSKHYFTRRKNP